jgi:hypothetical protein
MGDSEARANHLRRRRQRGRDLCAREDSIWSRIAEAVGVIGIRYIFAYNVVERQLQTAPQFAQCASK